MLIEWISNDSISRNGNKPEAKGTKKTNKKQKRITFRFRRRCRDRRHRWSLRNRPHPRPVATGQAKKKKHLKSMANGIK